MALKGGALDRPTERPNAPEYPPEVVTRMKQMGIWHPGITYPPGSRLGQHESELMANILSQYQRGQELEETRAYRQEASQANREQREQAQQQLDEYRRGRLEQTGEVGAARKAQTLQYMLNDPTMAKIYEKNPEIRRRMADEMLRSTGIEPPTAPAPGVTAARGEFGPGGPPAAAPPLASPADVTTGTPVSTAGGGGGTPEAPRPLNRYFQPSRYAGSGLSPSQLARAASNLDKVQAADEYMNMLMYKRDIGAPQFEKIYGTSDPGLIRAGMPPAAAIPSIYGGRPTIPENAAVGYYSSKGEFLGPLYTETGEKLPMPKGATGIRGTAGITGLERSPEGTITGVPDYLKGVIAGRTPTGAVNAPTTEAMAPTPAPNVYRPDVGVFGGELGAGAVPAPAPRVPGAPPPPEAWRGPAVSAALASTIGTLFGAGQNPPFPPRAPGTRQMY
jgi:hypothetical protein